MTDTQNTTGTLTEPTLPSFDGRSVIASSISIRKAGDGLSDALDIDPQAFSIGERVYVVLETEVTAVDHHPIPKAEHVLARKHVLTTEIATIVGADLVEAALAAEKAKVAEYRLQQQKAKEAEAGVQRVPGTEPWAGGEEDGGDLPPDGYGEDDDDLPGAGSGTEEDETDG